MGNSRLLIVDDEEIRRVIVEALGMEPNEWRETQERVRECATCFRAPSASACYHPHFQRCPIGASENSPAIHRWDDVAGRDLSPVGTIEPTSGIHP
ncbi:MAG: hypothetical protein WBE26_05520, partial [Phycisphaerae bacterium]